MGLFGGKKTYVASTVYNMAGPEEDRVNYLKTTIFGNVISKQGFDAARMFNEAYINGPGMDMRNFFNWAKRNYGLIGIPEGRSSSTGSIDPDIIKNEIEEDLTGTIAIQSVKVGIADYAYWADQWMIENYPELLNTEWLSDFNGSTNTVTITFEDTTEESFVISDFDPKANYVYAYYNVLSGESAGAIIEGDWVELLEEEEFPATDGWEEVSDDTVGSPVEIRTVIKENTEYQGLDPSGNDRTISIRTIQTNETTSEAGVVSLRRYKQDTQEITNTSISQIKFWNYKIGSGNVDIDRAITEGGSTGEYFPFIPLRLDNKFVDDIGREDVYNLVKKTYRKATGRKVDDIIEKIADNESLEDIDYAYIFYGVSLNAVESTAKEYIYRFFKKIYDSQILDIDDYEAWEAQQAEYASAIEAFADWRSAQDDPSNPLYNTPRPSMPNLRNEPEKSIDIEGTGSFNTNLDIKLIWNQVLERGGMGEGRPGAKRGDYWIQANTIPNEKLGFLPLYFDGNTISTQERPSSIFEVFHQVNDNNWKSLIVFNAVHENKIYNGKSVITGAGEALGEEKESGFIIPLSIDIIKEMGLVKTTQLTTACTYIVFNSYKVVKKKWYQTGFFKIFVFVAIIAIAVFTGGIGAGSVGLLGTAGAVGAAIGLTGVVAIIAGAIVNALVAMIVLRIIQEGANVLFGDKIGAIIGAVVGVVAIATGTALMNGASLSAAWGQLMSVQGIMNMTSAVGTGVTGYINASIMEMSLDTNKILEDAQAESRRITQLYMEQFGSNVLLDPTILTEEENFPSYEKLDTFLARTLLTGGDIAQLSMDMLSGFTTYTLNAEIIP